jgi:hypothetical protein
MEPFITRDGHFLFFNNSNNPRVDTNLYWATRIDDLTFQFAGSDCGRQHDVPGCGRVDGAEHYFLLHFSKKLRGNGLG